MSEKFPPPEPPFIKARYHGGSQKPKAIVLHGTVSSDNAGTARNIAEWWAGPSSPKSSCHYVVDPKAIFQCVGDHTVAYHCGYNTGSIGVEFCDEQTGPASRWSDADSTAILRRAARLTAELCLAYGIEAKRPTIAELKAKGPHGIYGHNDSRLAFGGTTHTDPRDFPWALFMGMVRREIRKIRRAANPPAPVPAPEPKPEPKPLRLHLMHASMQYSDTRSQMHDDAHKIFDRAEKRKAAWITGTEAGSDKLRDILRAACDAHGYRLFFGNRNDSWVAVRRDLIKGKVEVEYEPLVLTGEGIGHHGPRGVLAVSFDTTLEGLGRVTVLATHYLTKGRPNAKGLYRTNLPFNQKLANEAGRLAREHGKGTALVFFGGDQNIVDRTEDTFLGQPLTSSWDELEKYENTGHGNIDVIASYDKDGRVSAAYCRALDDKEFSLHTDHFLVESGFDVKAL